jgi:hypothetical protein
MKTHGQSGTPEYLTWTTMRGRCVARGDKFISQLATGNGTSKYLGTFDTAKAANAAFLRARAAMKESAK